MRGPSGIDLKKTVALAPLAAAVASLAVPAGAQDASPDAPAAYEASSSAQALELSLFGQGLVIGQSSSRVSPAVSTVMP